ncbi:histidinol-phosphate transaminase [Halorhodospira neutriphila]|uniref:Histidinol-phosphate aminotransferase n=1 Tax=Halorhodospira neutriphila TaxID=168379 RepID=A0ABS1E4B5_9GAMM|nr:histidinol-phosphate transaminase [Halorhodospira neutriphila]
MSEAERRAARWVRPEVQALQAYQVAEPGDAIKLDAMECPWPWPGALVEQWLERLRGVAVHRYPDPGAGRLKGQLREAMGVPDGAGLILGNGSDELIQLLNLAVAAGGRTVLAPAPSFAMYRLLAAAAGAEYAEFPLGEAFGLDTAAARAALEAHAPAVTYLAHPNNPTGNGLDLEAVAAVAEAADGLVVVDEAYYAYAEASFLPRVLEHPNVVVLRTLSKVGLAGLRVGVLAGHPAWVRELEKCRLPYNLGSLAQASAEFALEHRAALDTAVARVRAERERLAAELPRVPGVEATWPSETNFLTFRVAAGRAQAVYEGLRARGVLIKRLDGSHPRLAGCLRVTVGRPEENDAFLAALAAALAA